MPNVSKLTAALAVALMVFALAAPASALPGQCDELCTCAHNCQARCAIGGWVITCGYFGTCLGMCRSTEVTTATLETQASPDDDALLARILEQPTCQTTTAAAAH
jgi:hypothetical protein